MPPAPAAFRVWQPAQPALVNTLLPAAGSPPPGPDAAVVVGGVVVVTGDVVDAVGRAAETVTVRVRGAPA